MKTDSDTEKKGIAGAGGRGGRITEWDLKGTNLSFNLQHPFKYCSSFTNRDVKCQV